MLDSLPSYVENYFNYMTTIKAKSFNTNHCYRYDLIEFFNYMNNNILLNKLERLDMIVIDDLKSLELTDFYNYILYLKANNNLKSSSANRKLASIKSLFNYLCNKEKLLETNVTKELTYSLLPRKIPIYLTLEESKTLLKSVTGKNSERDFAILLLFLTSGIRLSELINIKMNDIKNDLLIVTGKSDKERTIPLNKSCIVAIDEYLKIRSKLNVKTDILFVTIRKTKMSPDSIQLLMKKYLKLSELSNKYSPHKLRHTAATLMYKQNVDIIALKELLGHESIQTTAIYTHTDVKNIKDALDGHPLNKK